MCLLVDGNWSDWGPFGECSIMCSNRNGTGPVSGEYTRTRTCDNPPAQFGGQPCFGSDTETVTCTPINICPSTSYVKRSRFLPCVY